MSAPVKEWSVYIIEAENGFLYTGITKDLDRRYEEHQAGEKSAKFFRSSPPKAMVYSKSGFTYSDALKEEHRIKKLSKPQKLKFIESALLKRMKKMTTKRKLK